jgi:phospholipid/cholesterol/gamma-HCH transport system substrate-binding protein
MSEKPHSVAIGGFIVGALLILVTTLLFISGSGLGRNDETVVMVFDGSVKGLTIGAPVALRGVEVGQVTDIDLIFDTSSIDLIMVVEAKIQGENVQRRGGITEDLTEEMIQSGLRAQLNSQSILTGLLYIQLDFHPGSKLVLADLETDHIQIPTIPTDLERLTQEIQSIDFAQIADDLQTIVDGLGQFTSNASFQAIPGQLEQTLASLNQLTEQLSGQLATTGPQLNHMLAKVADTATTLDREIPLLSNSARDSMTQLDQAVAQIEAVAINAQGLIADDSPTTYQLNEALRELALAGRALQSLAKTIEDQPESLIRGKKPTE